jgi:hypothetical protein
MFCSLSPVLQMSTSCQRYYDPLKIIQVELRLQISATATLISTAAAAAAATVLPQLTTNVLK